MQREHVSQFALVKFRMTEHIQYKTEYGRRTVLNFSMKTSVYRKERKKAFWGHS